MVGRQFPYRFMSTTQAHLEQFNCVLPGKTFKTCTTSHGCFLVKLRLASAHKGRYRVPNDLEDGQARYVLSPDFFFRNSPQGFLAECIRTPASVILDHPRALSLIDVFRTPVSVREATQQTSLAREDAQALVTLLIESGVLVVHTTQDPHTEFLEFHDALMHARSRAAPFANFGLAPEGAPSQHPGGAASNAYDISLPAPHADEDSYRYNSFHDVLRHRRTARTWSSNQLALSSLAEFLHTRVPSLTLIRWN